MLPLPQPGMSCRKSTMTTTRILQPSAEARGALARRGGGNASRCYQCGTCTSACDLVSEGIQFPRRQVLMAQWGLTDQLAADPAVWLCHQCNDCTARCPRDARPGDVLQAARALAVEALAAPQFMGHLVAKARLFWPLLLGLPILFFVVLLALTGNLGVPEPPFPHGEFAYELFVPHSLIYAIFFPVAGIVTLAFLVSGSRFWASLEGAEKRQGSFLSALVPVCTDILTHKQFSKCTEARPRRRGHLWLVLGFIGAALTSGLLIVAIYVMHEPMPLAQNHPFKLLGNLSAILLVVGADWLVVMRTDSKEPGGKSSAFDVFFLSVVALVILTGVVTEAGRFVLPLSVACGLYIVHLGAVLCLFLTCPYSKFAHLVYRTLAMIHERMIPGAR